MLSRVLVSSAFVALAAAAPAFATTKSVPYGPATADFSFSGGPTSDKVAYDITTSYDANNIYIHMQANPAGITSDSYDPSLSFANLYFGTVAGSGSNVAFEFDNSRAFIPGGSGFFNYTSAVGIVDSTIPGAGYTPGPAVGVEKDITIPWSFFLNDPLGIGFTETSAVNNVLTLRLSQSFGYGVAGGSSFGTDRLGQFVYSAVPEPASLGLLGLGAMALLARRKKA